MNRNTTIASLQIEEKCTQPSYIKKLGKIMLSILIFLRFCLLLNCDQGFFYLLILDTINCISLGAVG